MSKNVSRTAGPALKQLGPVYPMSPWGLDYIFILPFQFAVITIIQVNTTNIVEVNMPYKTKEEKNANARTYYQKHLEKFKTLRKKSKKWTDDYNHDYYRKNVNKLKDRANRKYHEMKKNFPELLKKLRQQERDIKLFGHTRQEIFVLKGDKCSRCRKPAEAIHHMDRNGRNFSNKGLKPGTDIDRLEPICLSCHIEEHRKELTTARNRFYTKWWSPKHRLQKCLMCHSDKHRHSQHGYCIKCFHRWKYGHKPRKKKKEPGV